MLRASLRPGTFVGSWLSLLAFVIAMLLPAEALADVRYRSRSWIYPVNPTAVSVANARNIFQGLSEPGVAYGCTQVPSVAGINNQSLVPLGASSNIAYYLTSRFTVSAQQAGVWSFRWGGDFSFGGALVVDGITLRERWPAAQGGNDADMYWNNSFADPQQHLAGAINLAEGTHSFEFIAFEGSDDRVMQAEFQAPGQPFVVLSNANLPSLSSPGCATPLLALSSSAQPATVAAGGQTTVTLRQTFDGVTAMTSGAVVLTLPANLNFVSAQNGGAYDGNTRKITWSFPSVNAMSQTQVTAVLGVAKPIANGTQLVAAGTVTGTNNAVALSSSANSTITATAAPALSLGSVCAPNPVAAGAPVQCTLTYGNTGSDTASTTVITAPVPAGTTFASATAGGAFAAGQVKWTIGALTAAATGTVSYTVNVNAAAADQSVLTFPASIAATNATTVNAQSTSKVSRTALVTLVFGPVPTPVPAGSEYTYQLVAENQGNAPAEQMVIKLQLPVEVEFVSAPALDRFDVATRTVFFPSKTLDPKGQDKRSVTARVKVPMANNTVLRAVATLEAKGASPITIDASTVAASASLPSVAGRVSSSFVAAGDEVQSTFTVGNAGTENTLPAQLVMTLPEGVSVVNASAGSSFDAGSRVLTWSLGALGARSTQELAATLLVDGNLADGTALALEGELQVPGSAGLRSGALTVTVRQPVVATELPQGGASASNGGCSSAGGARVPAPSLFGALGVLLFSLRRRRRARSS